MLVGAAVRARCETAPPQPCLQAIAAAERAQRTPPKLMRAIGVVESGRPDPRTGAVQPWPWTINAEGQGRFFDSKADAVAAVRALQARGVRSVDVGCMQVNLMHHPTAFASLEEAFDPAANAAYAARFLSALHHDLGDWPRATAAYHSQTEMLGADYARKVMAVLGQPFAMPYPALQDKFVSGFLATDRQYGAFPPQQMIFGAFADPAFRAASLRGFGGLPAARTDDRAAARRQRQRIGSLFLTKPSLAE